MWYLCGLGSNIAPEENLPHAVAELLERFGRLWLSSVIRTTPEGIDTPNAFLNALVVFKSEQTPEQLKATLNGLEEDLGRDRSDPQRSVKDRTIDIDILCCDATDLQFRQCEVTEPYFKDLMSGREDPSLRVAVRLEGCSLGQAPATINRDLGAGHKIVVNQSQQLNDDTVKTAFSPGERF